MDPKNWQKVRSVLELSLELPPDERAEFLDSACTDEEIRREVDSLLAFEDGDDGALETPAISSVIGDRNGRSAISLSGQLIGKYRIEREIGAGGMGTVYLAHRADGEFDQRVAIKLISGGLDSEAILRRFLNERRILASLEHPNIARLIDGGTTEEGRPYLVMEYIEGAPITSFAADEGLDIMQRLDLFRDVCSAVSVAHQNLIIHRDLKPSNILVGKDAKPKLLDFGIAKLLGNGEIDRTRTHQFAFTPEYASPEQIRGENLTTATDVYSLGVILYELLAGTRPFAFEGKGLGQMIDIATMSQPTRPSSVVKRIEDGKRLRGDLDNIVLKALSKEPKRRYTTVQEFSDDIRRYLKGLPVRARQDTFGYRAGKFARRNPLTVASVILTFLVLIGGIVAATYLARQAEIERQKAENRFNDVRTLANSFIFEINEKIEESPIRARELLVTRAVEYLDKLAAESEGDQGLQAELAAAYEKIGNVQSEYFGSGTGNTSGAIDSHQKARQIREKLVASSPENTQYALDLAGSVLRIADLSVTAGQMDTALQHYDRSTSLVEELADKRPDDTQVKRALARAYAKQGQGILRSGSISRSLEKYERAIEVMSQLHSADPTDLEFFHYISVYESYAGYAKLEMGRTEDAVRHFERSLAIDRQILADDPANVEYRRNLGTAELWTGVGLRSLQRYDQSLQHLKRALEIQQELYTLDPSNVGDLNSLADSYLETGWALSEKGDRRESIPHLHKAISLYEDVAKTDTGNLSAQRQIAFTRIKLGDAFSGSGNRAAAAELYKNAHGQLEQLVAKDPLNTEFRHDKAVCLIRLAELDKRAGVKLNEAIEILELLVSESPEHIRRRADLEKARSLLTRSA